MSLLLFPNTSGPTRYVFVLFCSLLFYIFLIRFLSVVRVAAACSSFRRRIRLVDVMWYLISVVEKAAVRDCFQGVLCQWETSLCGGRASTWPGERTRDVAAKKNSSHDGCTEMKCHRGLRFVLLYVLDIFAPTAHTVVVSCITGDCSPLGIASVDLGRVVATPARDRTENNYY